MDLSKYEEGIKGFIQKKTPFEFKFKIMDQDAIEFSTQVLNFLLNELNMNNIKEEMSYFLKEFVTNANKSNLKRIHFITNELDINNEEDYQKGMKDFGEIFRKNLKDYNLQMKDWSFYTKVNFHVTGQVLRFSVKNSNCPANQEIKRVSTLVEKSKYIRDIAEAFLTLGDNTEGAGLGTVSTIILLRNLGLSEKAFTFESDGVLGETVARIEIPLNIMTEKQAENISDEIVKEIDSLPVFPENISRIEKMIADGNVEFQKVADVIQSDLTLTAELLKMVNSAQYMLPQRVVNITNALSLVGMKGLKNLLYSYGTQKNFEKEYGRMDALWEHAFCCASYSYNLAKELKLNQLLDDAYIGGILHDIGKIIVYHVHPGLLERIKEHCSNKGIKENLLESLALGVSHSYIGAEVARKWNFPDRMVDVIRFHHQPLIAPDESRALVELVYLANSLTRIQSGEFDYAMLEQDILKKYNLGSVENILKLEKKLNKLYVDQKNKVREG